MIEPRPQLLEMPPYRPGKPEGLPAGVRLVNLAANENAWGPSPLVPAALAELALHRYPDMAGQELLGRLAALLDVGGDQLALGTGSGHLIKCLAEAYLRPGDLVLQTHPTFSLYRSAAALMGARVAELPGDGREVRFAGLPDAVRALRPRLVFACSPNNPTGDVLEQAVLEATLQALPEEGLLVVDEAYVHFADHPADAVAAVRRGAPVAVLRTFSKAYGLAALRLGVLVGPAEVVSAGLRVREPFPASVPALRAAAAALRDGDHLAAVLRAVCAGRERLRAGLAERGFGVHPGQGNFVWAEVPGGSGGEVVEALHRAGVLIRDGAGFGVPSHVRITVGTEEELDLLFAALDRMRGG